MPEEATLTHPGTDDVPFNPTTDSPPPSDEFAKMVANFNKGMDDVTGPPQKPAKPMDLSPKPLPEISRRRQEDRIDSVNPKQPSGPDSPEPAAAAATSKSTEKADKPLEKSIDDEKPPRTSAEWKALKAKQQSELAARDARIKEFEEKLAKTPNGPQRDPGDVQRLAALEQETETLRKEIKAVNLERDPAFRQYYAEKFGSEIEAARSAVPTEQSAAVEALLKSPDSKSRREGLVEIMQGLDPIASQQLLSAVTAYDRLARERQKQVENASQNWDRVEEFRKVEASKERDNRTKQVNAWTEDALKEAEGNFEGFKARDGDEAHNAEVKSRQQFVRDYLQGNFKDPALLRKVPVLAMEGLRLQKVIPLLMEQNARLEAQLKEISSTDPKLDGSGADTAKGVAEMGFAESYFHHMGKK